MTLGLIQLKVFTNVELLLPETGGPVLLLSHLLSSLSNLTFLQNSTELTKNRSNGPV